MSEQRTKGYAGRMEETKHSKQMKVTREQRKYEKQMKLRDKHEDDGTDLDESLSLATVNNEDIHQNDRDSISDNVSETDSFCRHCLRPQSELQLRYLRPRQRSKLRQQQQVKRERSKQRYSSYCSGSGSGNSNMSAAGNQTHKTRLKKSRSKSRAKRAHNNKHHSFNSSSNKNNNNKEQNIKLPLIRDLNAANEQAIRFRCPQVGPQVGRDRQMPPMLHFHHPQHVQKELTAYQLQYTHVYGQHQQNYGDQQVISPMQTTTLTMESELKQQQQQYQHHHHLYHHHYHHQQHMCPHHNEHLSNNQKSQQKQQLVTPVKDLTATNTLSATTTTVATRTMVNNLQNCCSLCHQQNRQPIHQPSPQCSSSDCKQQINCCNTNTTAAACCCCCYNNTAVTAAMQHCNHQHHLTYKQPYALHHKRQCQHQQHHNLPQLPLTHLETAATTAVASLDTTALVVTATATTTTSCTINSRSLGPTDEDRNLNLNNPTTAEEDLSNLAAATTPDSPSLVKVSTWYTVAKQGVSC